MRVVNKSFMDRLRLKVNESDIHRALWDRHLRKLGPQVTVVDHAIRDCFNFVDGGFGANRDYVFNILATLTGEEPEEVGPIMFMIDDALLEAVTEGLLRKDDAGYFYMNYPWSKDEG